MINAAESINRAGTAKGCIGVDANIEKVDFIDMVHIRVKDNGRGILPEDINRLFDRGFTTKQEKEISGIGLHWCANTVSAMHGRLWAQSDGLGHGACLHLLLPLNADKNTNSQNSEVMKL